MGNAAEPADVDNFVGNGASGKDNFVGNAVKLPAPNPSPKGAAHLSPGRKSWGSEKKEPIPLCRRPLP